MLSTVYSILDLERWAAEIGKPLSLACYNRIPRRLCNGSQSCINSTALEKKGKGAKRTFILKLPKRSKRIPIVIRIMLPNETLQLSRCSLRVPKGDPGEEVVNDMPVIVRDVVQEETLCHPKKGRSKVSLRHARRSILPFDNVGDVCPCDGAELHTNGEHNIRKDPCELQRKKE